MPTLPEPPTNASSNEANEPLQEPGMPELPAKVVELLNTIPEPQRTALISSLEEEIQIVQETTTTKTYSGLLPHPDILKETEAIVPGAARQIVDMTLEEGIHRRVLERRIIHSQTKESGRGQIFGFLIATIVILVSGFLVYTGHEISGSILGSLDLIGLVSIFVLGKEYRRKELETNTNLKNQERFQELLEEISKQDKQ